MLKGKTVVLAVSGSIAAYKIASLASALGKLHADVQVLMTQNATNFINPITFETLTGNKCLVDTFDRNFQYSVEHVALAKRADGTDNIRRILSRGEQQIVSWFRRIWKNMDMRKKSICIPEKLMFIH